jgi:hypothetical protein
MDIGDARPFGFAALEIRRGKDFQPGGILKK